EVIEVVGTAAAVAVAATAVVAAVVLARLGRAAAAAAAEARRVDRVEALRGRAAQGPYHRGLPDPAGDGGPVDVGVVAAADGDAGQVVTEGAARVAEADRGGEVGGVPGEPGGGVVVGGAGLTRGVTADAADLTHGALGEHAGQDVAGGVGDLFVQDLLALGLVRLGLAVPVGDLGDGDGLAVLAAGRDRGVGVGHGDRVHLVDAEREGLELAQRLAVGPLDAELLGRLDDLAEADLLLQRHEERVDRPPGTGLKGLEAASALAGVAHDVAGLAHPVAL